MLDATGSLQPLWLADDQAVLLAGESAGQRLVVLGAAPSLSAQLPLTPSYPRAVAEADSVALDPHKWLFVPVEAGLVVVRDAEAMRSAFSLVPPYIRQSGSAGEVYGLPWFSEYGFQQTRGFRALKVWMTMQQFGMKGYKAAIEENLALASYLADRVRSAPDLGLMAPPSLSVVCFRFLDPSLPDDDAIAALNRALLERLQLGGEAFLTSTELRGRFVLRACIVNYRSRREDVDRMIGGYAK